MMYAQLINWERPKHYRSYRNIEQWIIRNLMSYGNCYMKKEKYYSIQRDYEKLFGKKNITIQDVDSKTIVVSINQEAKNKAVSLVLY